MTYPGRISAAHWGLFRVEVRDGRAVATHPFEADPAPPAMLPVAVEGLYSPLRIARPAVRQSWLDHGPGARPELRGRDPFVEVGWDLAERLVAAEVQRLRARHGNESLYAGSYGWGSAGRFHHAKSQLNRFLGVIGGAVTSHGNYSMGAGMAILPHVLGPEHPARGPGPDWALLEAHCELFVCFGGMAVKNARIDSGGVGRHLSESRPARARARGADFINISPQRSDMAPDLGAEWLAIVPGSDTALLLALAHTLLVEGLHDRDWLASRCTGFERVADYLTGAADGVVKSADWAAALVGIPAETIRALARRMAGRRVFLNLSLSVQRCDHGEMTYWAGILVAAMLGQIGRPGGGVGFGYMAIHGNGNETAAAALPTLPGLPNPVTLRIPVARLTDMLLNPGGAAQFDGQHFHYPDIRLIWWVGGNPFHHHQDLHRLIGALRRVETIVTHEPWWTPWARHSDIVLPATTPLERDDIMAVQADPTLAFMARAVPPQAEARDDHDIFLGIARQISDGAAARFSEDRSPADWLRHLWEAARERNAARGQPDLLPDFDSFRTMEHLTLPVLPPRDPLAAFCADPTGHPLGTPSGRIELWSQTIADFDLPDFPGHPAWFAPQEWAGAPLAQRYPLHLLSNQPANRLHSQSAMTPTGGGPAAGGREYLRLHPADAAARNIRAGDAVRAFNVRGAFLALAELSEELRPGVVVIPTGAWFDPVDPGCPGTLDRNSNPNAVTLDLPSSALGQATSAQTALVEVARWVDPLPELQVARPPVLLRR